MLSDEQENRLQVIKDLAEISTARHVGGSSRPSLKKLMMAADWVIYGLDPEMDGTDFTMRAVPDLSGEPVTLDELVEVDIQTSRVIVHEIAVDGLPDMDELTGRVAFIWDGCIVSGWPLNSPDVRSARWRWEADSSIGRSRPFGGVTHWVEFPVTIQELTRGSA